MATREQQDRPVTAAEIATSEDASAEVLSRLGAMLREDDRRAHPRYAFRRPLVAIPLLPDGRPDLSRQLEGTSVDLSCGGIALELDTRDAPRGTPLLVGVREPNGAVRYAGVQIRHTRTLDPSRIRVGGQFGGVAEDILQSGNQLPMWDPVNMQFMLDYSPELLDEWERAGVLRRVLVDRVHLCPKCRGLPTFRFACRACGSARTTNERLIHHYACAHVARVEEFETTEGLVCPKCRVRSLVVGADYEFLTGPYRCLDCQWSDTDLASVAHCLRCGYRFPAEHARVEELYGFESRAMNVLDLLPGASAQAPSTYQVGLQRD